MNPTDLFPKPNPYAKSTFVRWCNKLLAGCIACMVKDSSDIKVERTPDGTLLSLSEQHKNLSRLSYKHDGYYAGFTGDPTTVDEDFNYFDPYKPYNIGNIVRVDKVYYAGEDYVKANDPNNEDEDINLYVQPGVYICVATVPAWRYPFDDTDSFSRQANIIYAPMYPEPKRLASRQVSGPDTPAAEDYQTWQGRYWELISFLPQMTNVCVNGAPREVYVQGAVATTEPADYEALPGVQYP
jgi:hypothetical protein